MMTVANGLMYCGVAPLIISTTSALLCLDEVQECVGKVFQLEVEQATVDEGLVAVLSG